MKSFIAIALCLMLAGTAGAHFDKMCCDSENGFDNCLSCPDPKLDELISAAEGVLPCLYISSRTEIRTLEYRTPADDLRRAADKMEMCDAAIKRLNKALDDVRRK